MIYCEPVTELPHDASQSHYVRLFDVVKHGELLSIVEAMLLKSAHDVVLGVGTHPPAWLIGAFL